MVVMKPDKIGDADFANYFCTYGYLYHQKDMLEDQQRMTAYHDAVRLNPALFRGKTVLDVGTGSGILAIWAAQCGARKVYAVEATYMATHAKKLVEANGLGDVVTIIQSTVEEVELPEQVDVIISEWMGYFLLRESMFDSVIVARDRWLKPGGAMFPSARDDVHRAHSDRGERPEARRVRGQLPRVGRVRGRHQGPLRRGHERADGDFRRGAAGVFPQHLRVGGHSPEPGARQGVRDLRLGFAPRHPRGHQEPGRAVRAEDPRVRTRADRPRLEPSRGGSTSPFGDPTPTRAKTSST